ncbi:MAG: hypothetical protein OEY16_00305 [Alphaproteobacteria bacterium]|nr:hypothetical protein [Alphaproteobacteria bacterium]
MKKTDLWLAPTILGAGALLAVATVAPALASHGGSPSPELNVVGQLSTAGLGIPGGDNVTDVWALGNYAYLGTFDEGVCSLDFTGIHIVDIANPANPAKVGFIPAKPGTRNNDVKVAHIETSYFSGDILVASNEACGSPFLPRLHANGAGAIPGQGGLSIWDVSNPEKPKQLRQNFFKFGVHNTFIWQQDDSAYMLVVDDENVQDLHIVDISKPQDPREIAVTGKNDWPDDIAAEFGETAGVFLHDIWVQENGGNVIAYLAYWDAGLVMLDITNPHDPVFLGDSSYGVPDPLSGEFPSGDGHVAVPNAGGTRVLFGDEDFAAGALNTFTFDGIGYPVSEGGFTPPTYSLPGGTFGGPVHWTGSHGCTTADFDRIAGPGEVALIQRGVCFFSTKAANAQALGYAGFIVANDAARGDALITMSSGTADVITIPGYFVGNSTGEIMKAGEGNLMAASGIFDGYGYLRLLDVEDPANITEVDQFATEGVLANPPIPGDRTMHNVVVDGGDNAYISWYAEGMRVVSFASDTLTETAHFVDIDEDGNGRSNFWGVYLHDHPNGNSYILGSDRGTGLWIFEKP